MHFIQSLHNSQLKHLSKLLVSAKARRAAAQTVLEGIHLTEAYLQAGLLPQAVFVPEGRLAHAETAALLARLPENRITVVGGAALGKISSLHQADDVMALIALPPQQAAPAQGRFVLLDRVQDPGNIGTVLRSAAAAGVEHILLSTGCADVWSPKVLRAGMGAHFVLKLYEQVDLAAWCAAYRGRVLAAALAAERCCGLYEADLTGETAWVFGNEGGGIAEELLEAADMRIRIPMAAGVESLNVAMAATVCLFEQMRQNLPK